MTKITGRRAGFWIGAYLGLAAGWALAQQMWALWQVGRRDVHNTLKTHTNRAARGQLFGNVIETDTFTLHHSLENGIERVSYRPKQPRFKTPLLFQHGMWHGAWCWQQWQEMFAEWGWESHAYSLPGHAASPTQRHVALCTLDYYLAFLKDEVERLERPPILVGHSMGGALTQWYIKYVKDLPAAVLVAPWPSHSAFRGGAALPEMVRLDPVGCLLSSLKWQAMFGAHNPASTAALLITDGAIYSPEELYARLDPESMLVLYQHNAPFWYPPAEIYTPMLWLAGEKDATTPEEAQWRSAGYYQADYRVIENAGHNLMMEHNYRQTAGLIHNWLIDQSLE